MQYIRRIVWPLLSICSIILQISCGRPNDPSPDGPDTTSHNFVWTIDTLGEGGSSILWDVAVIDENDIWAVGEIYLRDSTGSIDPTAYGLAKWNGISWSVHRLTVVGPTGFRANLKPRAIWAFSDSDVWFAGSSVHRLRNNAFTSYWIHPFPGNPSPVLLDGQSAEEIWGNNPTDLYVVGSAGAIAHFDGNAWNRIESGTTVDLSDVYGPTMTGSTASECFVAGYDAGLAGSGVLFLVKSTSTVTPISWQQSAHPHGVWIDNQSTLYASGSGLWKRVGVEWVQIDPMVFLNRVRGSGWNDVFAVGSYLYISHFNGSSWHRYSEFDDRNALWNEIAVGPGIVAAVGRSSDRTFVLIGRRM